MKKTLRPSKIRIFSDFDGTITSVDVWKEIFKKFGKLEPYFSLLINSKLSLKEFWFQIFQNLPLNSKLEEFNRWAVDNVEVDANFFNFINFCQEHNIPFEIVSDGFEFYVSAFLDKMGLIKKLPFVANEVINYGGVYKPIFPFASESCMCNAASCKRNVVLSKLQDQEVLIYIGDGYSDFCLAQYADIIFAKNVFSRFCSEKKIPHYPYKSFADVQSFLKMIITKKKLKFRRQAYLARLKAFQNE